jgi:hypothetical protein
MGRMDGFGGFSKGRELTLVHGRGLTLVDDRKLTPVNGRSLTHDNGRSYFSRRLTWMRMGLPRKP